MVSEIAAQKIMIECLDELYKNCTPPIQWGMLELLYGGTEIPFYEKHTIDEKKYEEIIAKYKKKLGPHAKDMGMTLLNYAPKVNYK